MVTKRNVYLDMKTLKEAKKILMDNFSTKGLLSKEMVPVPDAVGRVLSEPVTAKLSSPGFHSAAMDGIAVKAEQTFGAGEMKPKKLAVGKNAFFVNTGHVMPDNTDAVIMMEHLNIIDDDIIEIEAPAFPWQNVRKMGEDIVATELIFPRNHLVTPYCVGALLSGGIFSVSVRTKPKVLIIPTGSELLDWQLEEFQISPLEHLKPGRVIESNSFVLGKMAEACGGVFVRHNILKDDREVIKKIVNDACSRDFDMILTVGGSSAGSEDFTKWIVESLGRVLVHGVTIMPGKPILIGKIKDKPFFGIPGYPVSAIIAFEEFVQPLICKMLGRPEEDRSEVQVELTRKVPSKLGIEEFLRVKLGRVGDKISAIPLPGGAGCITTITEADGIIRIPNQVEGLTDKKQLTAELLRPLASVDNTIVVVGSHDNTLDLLADQIKASHTGLTLSSSHVGSMGGLIAVKKGVCHLAGSHLLDTENGSYNISYIKKFLPDMNIKLVNLVIRDQGLIIQAGNPKKIKGIADLARDDIVIINRQSGSGTRILLDYRLKELGINPQNINGYKNEEYTHMSVGVAVLSGTADAGLGIYAAARALKLDFIPVVTEQYDLVIPEEYFESEKIRALLEIINTKEFQKRVAGLGGYSTEKTGEIIL